jgi:hypothetical protein
VFGREPWREPWGVFGREFGREFDREFGREFGRKFGREFDIEPWRVLSIGLISMCYEACMKHTMK